MGIINSAFLPISQLLTDHKYHIPEYQRGYAWEETQLDDFWTDLMHLHTDQSIKNHFLGQIVVHNDEDETKKLFIIDGQQRTTTSIIFLDVLRTKFTDIHNNYSNADAFDDSSDITSKYIGRLTDSKQDHQLILGDTDRKIFEMCIQKRDKSIISEINKNYLKPSEKRILEAREFFVNKLEDFLKDIKDTDILYQKTHSLLDDFLRKFKVMYVETNDINEAFIIFETLNARGKDLATSDLLKNHLFRIADSKLPDVKNDWNKMIENLDGVDPTKFIRHFWNSQEKFAREKDLYKLIRNNIDTPKKAENLIDSLVESSSIYKFLTLPNEDSFFQDPYLNERVGDLNIINAKSFYPIVLALSKEDFDEAEINEVLKTIENLIVRNSVVSGKTSNKFETVFASIAYSISQHKLNSVDLINKEISQYMIDNEKFKYDFSTFTVKNKGVQRYLLRKISTYNNDETRIINDNHMVHVEHIMPKKPKEGEWNISPDEHKQFINTLGNLTLLGQEFNRNATNKSFTFKKDIYKKSNIKLTQQLAENKTWTIEDIENRQKHLAEIALKVWPKY